MKCHTCRNSKILKKMTKGSNGSQIIYEISNEISELELLNSYNEDKSKWNIAFQILREKYFQHRIPSSA